MTAFTTRPELRGPFGMVASTHWLASAGGMAVLFISAELEEVTRVSHRIAVMRDRRNVAQVDTDQQPDLHELIAASPS